MYRPIQLHSAISTCSWRFYFYTVAHDARLFLLVNGGSSSNSAIRLLAASFGDVKPRVTSKKLHLNQIHSLNHMSTTSETLLTSLFSYWIYCCRLLHKFLWLYVLCLYYYYHIRDDTPYSSLLVLEILYLTTSRHVEASCTQNVSRFMNLRLAICHRPTIGLTVNNVSEILNSNCIWC